MKELFNKYELGQCTSDEAAQVEAMLLSQPESCSAEILSGLRSLKYPNTIMDILIEDKDYENSLLLAYENGQCSDEEKEWVENLLTDKSDTMPDLYHDYSQAFKEMSSSHINYVMEVPTEDQLNQPNYSSEYLDYVKALKAIPAPQAVLAFSPPSISEEELLDKAEKNQLSVEEQQWFDVLSQDTERDEVYDLYVDVMKGQKSTKDYLSKLSTLTVETNKSSNIHQEEPAKESIIISLRKRIASIAAIAALFIFGLYGIQSLNQSSQPATAEVIEITDPEEALEVTLAALSMVGKKMNSGNEEISKIKHVGRTNIFK